MCKIAILLAVLVSANCIYFKYALNNNEISEIKVLETPQKTAEGAATWKNSTIPELLAMNFCTKDRNIEINYMLNATRLYRSTMFWQQLKAATPMFKQFFAKNAQILEAKIMDEAENVMKSVLVHGKGECAQKFDKYMSIVESLPVDILREIANVVGHHIHGKVQFLQLLRMLMPNTRVGQLKLYLFLDLYWKLKTNGMHFGKQASYIVAYNVAQTMAASQQFGALPKSLQLQVQNIRQSVSSMRGAILFFSDKICLENARNPGHYLTYVPKQQRHLRWTEGAPLAELGVSFGAQRNAVWQLDMRAPNLLDLYNSEHEFMMQMNTFEARPPADNAPGFTRWHITPLADEDIGFTLTHSDSTTLFCFSSRKSPLRAPAQLSGERECIWIPQSCANLHELNTL